MTAELLVNVTPSETRVAYIDGGILQEIHIEREARRGIVGNIYKGRVSRVLPGMQAAFVDIGLDKAAFLHASDIMPHTECVAGEEQKQFTVRDISELVRQGQDLMVQVVKDPLGTKGARLTTDITVRAVSCLLRPPRLSVVAPRPGPIRRLPPRTVRLSATGHRTRQSTASSVRAVTSLPQLSSRACEGSRCRGAMPPPSVHLWGNEVLVRRLRRRPGEHTMTVGVGIVSSRTSFSRRSINRVYVKAGTGQTGLYVFG